MGYASYLGLPMAKVFKAYSLNAVAIDFSNCLSAVKLGLLRLPHKRDLRNDLTFFQPMCPVLLPAVRRFLPQPSPPSGRLWLAKPAPCALSPELPSTHLCTGNILIVPATVHFFFLIIKIELNNNLWHLFKTYIVSKMILIDPKLIYPSLPNDLTIQN
jgi:hypothetical protein